LLKQHYLDCLAHASYLIAAEATGTAVVVDPQRDIDPCLADAQPHFWQIHHGFLTHFHTLVPSEQLEALPCFAYAAGLDLRTQRRVARDDFSSERTLVLQKRRATALTIRELVIEPGGSRMGTYPTDVAILVQAGSVQVVEGEKESGDAKLFSDARSLWATSHYELCTGD
jgi:hypothetical protein